MSEHGTDLRPPRRYRFGAFEVDTSTGELRRQGIRLKLNAQPFQVLLMLLERPGQLLTREEISRELWPEGTFVDYEHGVNSAMNRIREALGDTASNPRFVETLARRGYRFVAPVEEIGERKNPREPVAGVGAESAVPKPTNQDEIAGMTNIAPEDVGMKARYRILASTQELPRASYPVVRTLFVLLQLMYLGFYVGALTNLAEIADLLSPLPKTVQAINVVIVTAAILIPVRAFVLSAVLFRAPGAREKILKLWPALLVLDVLWSLSPFLLMHHINSGLATACMALLVYSPFAQRSLVLMGAGGVGRKTSITAR